MNNLYHNSEDTKNIFKIECEEIIRDFAKQLDLFKKNKDVEIITKLMRDAHSIKGSAGIAGYPDIQKSAHRIEDILSDIKNNKLTLNDEEFENIRQHIVCIAEYLKRRGKMTMCGEKSTCQNLIDKLIHTMYLLALN